MGNNRQYDLRHSLRDHRHYRERALRHRSLELSITHARMGILGVCPHLRDLGRCPRFLNSPIVDTASRVWNRVLSFARLSFHRESIRANRTLFRPRRNRTRILPLRESTSYEVVQPLTLLLKKILQHEQRIGWAFGQPPREVRVPLVAIGNVNPNVVSFLHQTCLQITPNT